MVPAWRRWRASSRTDSHRRQHTKPAAAPSRRRIARASGSRPVVETRPERAGRAPGSRVTDRDAVVGVLLGAVVLWRFAVLAGHVEPVGVDVANWVRTYRSWWGVVDIDDVVIPPIAPVVAGVTNSVFSLRWTSHLLMSIASVSPAVGAWTVIRTRSSAVLGCAAVAAIALTSSTAAAMAWGGLPQLLGLGVVAVFADRMNDFADEPLRRTAIVAGVWLALLAATSSLVLVAGLLIAGSMCAVAINRHGRAAASCIVWIALPTLPLVPLYVVMLSRVSIPESAVTGVGPRVALDTVLGSTEWLWAVLLAAGGFAAVHQSMTGDGRGRRLLPLALVGGAAVPVAFGELRFAYVLPMAIVIAVVLLLEATEGPPRIIAVLALIALAMAGPSSQTSSIDYYAQLVPDGVGPGIDWLGRMTGTDELVLVAPVNGAPFGWTVEASGTDALVASRDDWLLFPEERAASDRAVHLLSGDRWPTEDDLARIHAEGIGWVFVPVAWGGHDDRSVDVIEDRCPLRVPYRSESVIVLRTDDLCG